VEKSYHSLQTPRPQEKRISWLSSFSSSLKIRVHGKPRTGVAFRDKSWAGEGKRSGEGDQH
jgi:hypothetical protein